MDAKYADMPVIALFFVLLAVVVIIVAASVFFRGAFFMTGFVPFMGAMGILWVLFWIVLGIWFFRWMFGFGGHHRAWYREERAEWIARERYAKGEINKKEFGEIMKRLHEY